jgi:hypothetical protein
MKCEKDTFNTNGIISHLKIDLFNPGFKSKYLFLVIIINNHLTLNIEIFQE